MYFAIFLVLCLIKIKEIPVLKVNKNFQVGMILITRSADLLETDNYFGWGGLMQLDGTEREGVTFVGF